jgi:TetR/AcrR family transcriptional regulator
LDEKLTRDREELILQAAQHRFAAYGYSKVTMDEIALDLGISKAALYYYFSTKEEIFRQVIAREQREFIHLVEKINETKTTAKEKLLQYFQHYLTFFNELLNLKIISVQTVDIIHPIMSDLFRDFAKNECALIEAFLHEGKWTGEFAIDSAQKTASLLVHLLQGLRMRFFKTLSLRNLDETDVQTLQHEIKLFANIFLNGINSSENNFTK